jgi:outer membrane protein OmpA-like peptidoglycan-associated protein
MKRLSEFAALVLAIVVLPSAFGETLAGQPGRNHPPKLFYCLQGTRTAPTSDLFSAPLETSPTVIQPQAALDETLVDSVECSPSPEQVEARFCENDLSAAVNRLSARFSRDSFELAKGDMARLKRVAVILLNCPSLKITLAGRTDPSGSPAANQRLGNLRAEAATAFFAHMGVDAGQLKMAEWEPSKDNCARASRAYRLQCDARNRTVQISVAR